MTITIGLGCWEAPVNTSQTQRHCLRGYDWDEVEDSDDWRGVNGEEEEEVRIVVISGSVPATDELWPSNNRIWINVEFVLLWCPLRRRAWETLSMDWIDIWEFYRPQGRITQIRWGSEWRNVILNCNLQTPHLFKKGLQPNRLILDSRPVERSYDSE